MREFMDVAKALADDNRVRTLMILKDRELCVCQIIALLGLAPSTVSKHMAILRQARLVESRKEGRWNNYRRAEAGAGPYVADTLAWLDASLENNPTVRADQKKLKSILKLDPEEICRRQSRCG